MQKINNDQYGFGINNSKRPIWYILFVLILLSLMSIITFKYDIHQRIINSFNKAPKLSLSSTQIDTKNKISSISGLAIPRFVSLKDGEVNVRKGPGTKYEVSWVFFKKSLPVEITNEFGNWRQIRDSDGQEGWVFHSLLSSKRTVIFAPWENDGNLALYEHPDITFQKTALIEPRVIGYIKGCDNNFCQVKVENVVGFIEKKYLWGIYPNESIK